MYEKMEFSKGFKDWILDMISDRLDEYKDIEVYGADLAYKLFEGENVNGSVTCSTYEAKEFIKEHWDDAAEIYHHMKEYHDNVVNPFEDPEIFHVCMLQIGAQDIMLENTCTDENWNVEFTLDQAAINSIKTDLGIEYDEGIEIEALLVKPGEVPEKVYIEDTLENLQECVGGMIQVVYPSEDEVGFICNDEGKVNGLALNRALYDESGKMYDIIAGNFLIVGLGEEDFESLSDEHLAKYEEKFHYPEAFFNVNGDFQVIKKTDGIISLETEIDDARIASDDLNKDQASKVVDFNKDERSG